MSCQEHLVEDLFGIYATAGREVTYKTDSGDVRPYWANRYRQAVQRAVQKKNVVPFVEHLVQQPEPSRGFGYLIAASRPDLTVEALVVDESKDYHGLFSPQAVEAARTRLAEHGYEHPSKTPNVSDLIETGHVQPGATFDVRVTVHPNGELTLSLI